MTGISSYGAYIPITRLPFSVMGGKAAKEGDPEKAVAWADEDSITMAVAAAVSCLKGVDRTTIDGVLLATTTYPFDEKQGASIVAKALDLTGNVRTADVSGSLRSGTIALQSAVDAVKSGSLKNVLVVASDCRLGVQGSATDRNGGDGAAAFLVSANNVIATIEGVYTHANEMMDIWRKSGDTYVHTWEDRFINTHGYQENTIAAINGLFETLGKKAEDFTKAIVYGPDLRSHGGVIKATGIQKDQIQNPLFGKLGNTGTAFAPMLLVAALEESGAGDRLLVANYGDGGEALSIVVADGISSLEKRQAMAFHLQRRRTVDHYSKYVKAKGLQAGEYPEIDDQGISATVQYRNRDSNLSLQGQQCGGCGTHQFPKGRVCVRCGQKDEWTPVTYSEMTGKVLTYTFDAFFPSPEPPTVVAIAEVDDGPRIHMQFADAAAKDMDIGVAVEFIFRRIHQAGKRPNYFWKCRPVTGGAV